MCILRLQPLVTQTTVSCLTFTGTVCLLCHSTGTQFSAHDSTAISIHMGSTACSHSVVSCSCHVHGGLKHAQKHYMLINCICILSFLFIIFFLFLLLSLASFERFNEEEEEAGTAEGLSSMTTGGCKWCSCDTDLSHSSAPSVSFHITRSTYHTHNNIASHYITSSVNDLNGHIITYKWTSNRCNSTKHLHGTHYTLHVITHDNRLTYHHKIGKRLRLTHPVQVIQSFPHVAAHPPRCHALAAQRMWTDFVHTLHIIK